METKNGRFDGIISIIMGIAYFIGFAYDIEYDRDFMTWMWLLTSEIFFLNAIVIMIRKLTKNGTQ